MATGNIPEHLLSQFTSSINVISDRFMPDFHDVPVRKHQLKRWMTKSNYHERIQKKWNKRFGSERTRAILFHSGRIVCSPKTFHFVKSLLN